MFIGIDIGGTNIKGVSANRNGDIISFRKIPTEKSAFLIEKGILDLIEGLSADCGISRNRIKGIGIGSAGSIDTEKGIIITCPNIKSLNNYPLAVNIKKISGLKVFLVNDATAAVMGEWWKGHGKNFSNWIMLTLGTGIGGGAIINNSLYTGQSGNSMEVGHITIDYKGRKCLCGNTGCLEAYASATALVKHALLKLKKNSGSSLHARIKNERLTSKIVYEEACRGDQFAREVFNEISTYLGIGIANLVNIFNPQAVILGGGLSKAHRLILPVVKKTVNSRALKGLKENVKYLTTMDEGRLSALGAAKIAVDASE